MKRMRRVPSSLLVILFLVSFFLRAYYPLSRPDQWLARSERFNRAIDAGEWGMTYQSRHPGATVMVIGGLSLRLFDAVYDTPARSIFTWATPPFTTYFGERMAAGIMGLALIISLLIVGITLCLKKLSDWPFALAAGSLMTLSPLYLAECRVFHVDALVGSFMLLSALLLLIYLQGAHWLYLALSSLTGGLALLTKSPAMFLLPFTGLALLSYLVLEIRRDWPVHRVGRLKWLALSLGRKLALPLLAWIVFAGLPFALWPAMWVGAPAVLSKMFGGAIEHIGRAHIVPRFFAGRVHYGESPGWAFYPAMLTYHSTFVTITLLIVALGYYLLQIKRAKKPLTPTNFWLLVAYLVFFIIQMGLGAKKDKRYIVPADPILNILATAGLIGAVDLIRQAFSERAKRISRILPTLATGLAIALQAAAVLPYAPDCGAHRNHLLGGNRGALNVVGVMGQNEGVIAVSRYLSQQPEPGAKFVGVTYPLHFSLPQYFPGRIERGMPPDADYYLFSYVTMQRALDNEIWQPVWEALQEQKPLIVVSYDGVDYLWLYARDPSTANATTGYVRHGGSSLIGLAWLWTISWVVALIWLWWQDR